MFEPLNDDGIFLSVCRRFAVVLQILWILTCPFYFGAFLMVYLVHELPINDEQFRTISGIALWLVFAAVWFTINENKKLKGWFESNGGI